MICQPFLPLPTPHRQVLPKLSKEERRAAVAFAAAAKEQYRRYIGSAERVLALLSGSSGNGADAPAASPTKRARLDGASATCTRDMLMVPDNLRAGRVHDDLRMLGSERWGRAGRLRCG